MAYSTQKDFLKIGLLNQEVDSMGSTSIGKGLKSYMSCTDSRAWAFDKEQQTHYLSDLIACRPFKEVYGDGQNNITIPISCTNESCRQLSRINTNLQEKLNELKFAMRNIEGESRKELNVLNQKLLYYESEIADLRKINQNLIASNENLKVSNERLKAGFTELQVQHSQLQGEKEILGKQKNEAAGQLNKVAGMEKKIRALKQRALEADRMECEIRSLRQECNTIRQSGGGTIDNNVAAMVAERDHLQHRVKELQVELMHLKHSSEHLNKFKKEAEESNSHLQQLRQLHEELHYTKNKLAQTEKALHDYEGQMHHLMDIIEELQSHQKSSAPQDSKEEHLQSATDETERSQLCKIKQLRIASGDTPRVGVIDPPNVIKVASQKEVGNCENLQQRVKQLQIDLEKTKCDARKASCCLEEAEEKLKNMQRELKKTKEYLENCLKEKSSLQNDLECFQNEKKKLKIEMEQLVHELNSCAASNKEQMCLLAEAKQELEFYRCKLNECCSDLKAKTNDLLNANKCIEDFKLDKDKLEKELEKANLNIEDIRLKEKKTIEISHEKDNKIKTLEEENVELSRKIEALNVELEKQKNALKNVQSAMNQLKAEREAEAKEATNQLTKCQLDLQKLHEEHTAKMLQLEEEKQGLQEEISKNKMEMEKCGQLVGEIEAVREKNKTLQSYIENFDDILEKAAKPAVPDTAARKTLQASADEMKEAMAAQQQRINQLENELFLCQEELVATKKSTQVLQKETERLRAGAIKTQDFGKGLKDCCDHLANLNKSLEESDRYNEISRKFQDECKKSRQLECQLKEAKQQVNEIMRKALENQAKEAERQRAEVLQRMQHIHDMQLQELLNEHDKQVQALKCANQNLVGNLSHVKKFINQIKQCDATSIPQKLDEITKNISYLSPCPSPSVCQPQIIFKASTPKPCKSSESQPNDTSPRGHPISHGDPCSSISHASGQQEIISQNKRVCSCPIGFICLQVNSQCASKLLKISRKIVEKGMHSLDIKELTFLHGEVYKAGLRLKPELIRQCKDRQCCKCLAFTCCLPNVSKEREQKLMNRILSLETEVENANKLLDFLKKLVEGDKNKSSSRRLMAVGTSSATRYNDEINEFVKRASGGPSRNNLQKKK